MRARVTPLNLFKLIQALLSERHVTLGKEVDMIEKVISKRCPEELVLWSIVYDGLNIQIPLSITVIGYANDGAVVLEAGTSPELEYKAQLSLA